MLLRALPSLLPKCIHSLPASGDIQPSYEYLSVLSYTIYLLNNTEVDGLTKINAKKLSTAAQMERQTFFERLVSDMLPTGLAKRGLSRVIRSEFSLVQHTGLLLLRAVLERIRNVLRLSHPREHSDLGQTCLMLKELPDFNSLITFRSR